MRPFLTSRTFGVLPGGESVEAWTIGDAGGLVVEIITYGAIISRLLVPGVDGQPADVVLGYGNLDSYVADKAYFGAVVGRVAGRITNARFNLGGKGYKLSANDPPNHLHGGGAGLSRKLWTAEPLSGSGCSPALRLAYRSLDGEEGYPGNIEVAVTYSVTPDNVLVIESEATADRQTPLNLTYHSYFNLAGEGSGSVADHELQLHADHFVATDENMTLLGKLEPVAANNDFRNLRQLGDAIPGLFQEHGDLYRVRRSAAEEAARKPVPVARLVHRKSGRVMEVATMAEYIQLYTGAALDGSMIGKSGVPYRRHAGLCLECEGYPDGANVPSMGDIILRPDQVQRATSTFSFTSADS